MTQENVHRMGMRFLCLSMFVVACRPGDGGITGPDIATSRTPTVTSKYFAFLPPLTVLPATSDKLEQPFDASLSPEVRICILGVDGCESTLAVLTTRSFGSARVRPVLEDEHYITVWDTRSTDIEPGTWIRIAVNLPGPVHLGRMDLRVGPTGEELESFSGTIPIPTNHSLPIKFRIAVGAAPERLLVLDGDQLGLPNAELHNLVRVKALNLHGEGVPNAVVGSLVAEGMGSVSPAVASTDSQGIARFHWQLAEPGAHTVEFIHDSLDPAVAGAVALARTTSAQPLTLHMNATDPVILTLPAPDGEFVQLYGTRDASGLPLELTSLAKFSQTDPVAADIVTYDGAGDPNRVLLRDGTVATASVDGATLRLAIRTGHDTGLDVAIPIPAGMGTSTLGGEGPSPGVSATRISGSVHATTASSTILGTTAEVTDENGAAISDADVVGRFYASLFGPGGTVVADRSETITLPETGNAGIYRTTVDLGPFEPVSDKGWYCTVVGTLISGLCAVSGGPVGFAIATLGALDIALACQLAVRAGGFDVTTSDALNSICAQVASLLLMAITPCGLFGGALSELCSRLVYISLVTTSDVDPNREHVAKSVVWATTDEGPCGEDDTGDVRFRLNQLTELPRLRIQCFDEKSVYVCNEYVGSGTRTTNLVDGTSLSDAIDLFKWRVTLLSGDQIEGAWSARFPTTGGSWFGTWSGGYREETGQVIPSVSIWLGVERGTGNATFRGTEGDNATVAGEFAFGSRPDYEVAFTATCADP